MTGIFIRSGKFGHRHTEKKSCEVRHRQTQREEGHVKVKTDTRLMLPQTKEYLGLPLLEESRKDSLPEHGPANTLTLKS